ncbi:Iron-dependent extradiol dioxygenase [BD1-7 clade bacterium]|uniref:Iron-dependent extradiol dioxygenase n=1 Tax=BD1-7 clade bacterium TaxID=2029982 RepID=A0A5S9QBG9_9GAMM|nr:Iron-dependent extradiol dioxygenase [BD1-7 clade bacterium]CAA0115536.1 Iron-dependent extradiol dioxygenase [BD1-7 clade bacterium]
MQVQSLGYVVVGSTDLAKWEDYGVNVVGMMKSTSAPDNGSVYLKMDQRPFRYQVIEAPFDGLLFAGWDLGTEDAFNAGLAELDAKGIAYEKIEAADELAARAVSGLARLADPSGNQLELYWATGSLADDGVAFASGADVDGFVTNAEDGSDMGLGHVVLHAPTDFEGVHDFYASMGFLDADITDMSEQGMGKIYFMNCNSRHHSLALWSWGAPSPETDFKPSPESKAPGCVHLMAEVASLREVGSCLDRVNEREIMVVSSLGEHINDEMTSFYMLSPGNFALEFGFDGMQLDAEHETTHNTEASIWGHKWQG